MRWKPSNSDHLPDYIGYPLRVLCAPAIGMLLALLWLGDMKAKIMGPSAQWRPWFAWFPVTLNCDEDGDWLDHESEQRVWLEWVERRTDSWGNRIWYRPRLALQGADHV